jgi:sugar transferase (PEP-CTERM/EpsH1 system associated)
VARAVLRTSDVTASAAATTPELRREPVRRPAGRPRLLFVTQALPYPLTDGGSIRSFKLLEALAEAFAITLVASARDPGAVATPSHPLRQLCREVVCVPDAKDGSARFHAGVLARVALQGQPPAIAYNYNRGIRDAVRRCLRQGPADLVHLNHADAAQYLGEVRSGRCVVDTHNLLFDYHQKAAGQARGAARRLYHRLAARHLGRFERWAFARCDRVLVCSRRERERLRPLGLDRRAAVVPNGVDCDRFAPDREPGARGDPTVVFTGNMGYGPNHDAAVFFVREVLPLLRRQHPAVTFLAVGKQPAADLRRLAREHPGVTVTGEVPDVRPYLGAAAVFVAPLRFGAGTRLKLLEAFAAGVPVVSTRLGAEGLECADGRHLLVADDAPGLARQAGRLLADPALRGRLAGAARRLVRREYDWRAIGRRLLAVYDDLRGERPAA